MGFENQERYPPRMSSSPGSIESLRPARYISFETFRKNGTGVKTPVWFAIEEDRLVIFTAGGAYKVKRLARDMDLMCDSIKWDKARGPAVFICKVDDEALVDALKNQPNGRVYDAHAVKDKAGIRLEPLPAHKQALLDEIAKHQASLGPRHDFLELAGIPTLGAVRADGVVEMNEEAKP